MSEARVAPVLTRRIVDRLVLAEDHPPGEGGLGRRQAGGDRPLRPRTHAVEHSGDATPAPPGSARMVEEQLGRDAAVPQVSGEVGGGVEVAHATADRELVPYFDASRKRCPSRDAEEQPRVA